MVQNYHLAKVKLHEAAIRSKGVLGALRETEAIANNLASWKEITKLEEGPDGKFDVFYVVCTKMLKC